MATVEECRTALDQFAANLTRAGDGLKAAAELDRSLSCRITDLDTTFTGRLADGGIHGVEAVRGVPAQKAQIRLTTTGDDLVAMVAGELSFAKAWAAGRVKIQASLRDILRLRSLL